MSTFTKEEIAAVLKTAELLNQKGSSEKINISQFCREAGISRKNAYKHKRHLELSQDGLKEKLAQLEKKKIELEQMLELAETRAQQADLYSECLAFLRQYNLNKKKTRRQRELIESYNKLALSHGLKPLDFWE
jgi:ACT domain-containing protein